MGLRGSNKRIFHRDLFVIIMFPFLVPSKLFCFMRYFKKIINLIIFRADVEFKCKPFWSNEMNKIVAEVFPKDSKKALLKVN